MGQLRTLANRCRCCEGKGEVGGDLAWQDQLEASQRTFFNGGSARASEDGVAGVSSRSGGDAGRLAIMLQHSACSGSAMFYQLDYGRAFLIQHGADVWDV